jgi:hypothetical protein
MLALIRENGKRLSMVGALAPCLFAQSLDLVAKLGTFTLSLGVHALDLLAQHLNFDL